MLNPFILYNNCSVDESFLLLQLADQSLQESNGSRGVYKVFHELGSLKVTAYSCTDLKKAEHFFLATADKAQRKALELIRNKYVELSRPLVPVRYKKDDYFAFVHNALLQGFVTDNHFFSTEHKLFSLLNRFAPLNALFRQLLLMHPRAVITDDKLFSFVETQMGSGVLEDLFAFRTTHLEEHDGKIVRVIDNDVSYFLQNMPSSQETNDFVVSAKGRFWLSKEPSPVQGATLVAFVFDKGVCQRVPEQQERTGATRQFDGGVRFILYDDESKLYTIPEEEWTVLSQQASFLLYDKHQTLALSTEHAEAIPRRELVLEDDKANTEAQIVLNNIVFKKPIGCIQVPKDKLESISFAGNASYYTQPKLDGVRTCVFVEGESIAYFSRKGKRQPVKFNLVFDPAVKALYAKLETSRQVLFDCECYKHGLPHEKIAGFCNRKAPDSDFAQLELHVLSFVFVKPEEGAILTFGHSFRCLKSIQPQGGNVLFNKGSMVSHLNKLAETMEQAVLQGYEGLVLYPLQEAYTFGRDRLFKVKNVFDHECYPLSFLASEADPSIIGSVRVRCHRFFQEDKDFVEFNVAASLTDELREGSMSNHDFDRALNKPFTIVCDSFSEEGIPQHSRFKAPFSPDSDRKDL